MKTNILTFIYFIIGILFLIFEAHPSNIPAFTLKALIIPVLAVIFLINLRPGSELLHKLMLAGLFFSWSGDVLLEVPDNAADLGNMMIPVTIYTIVILAMVTGAINRLKKVNAVSYWLVLAGAILFLISDSALAIRKFGHPFPGSSIVIMSTYLLAQYLIITGFIRQFREKFI